MSSKYGPHDWRLCTIRVTLVYSKCCHTCFKKLSDGILQEIQFSPPPLPKEGLCAVIFLVPRHVVQYFLCVILIN